MPVRGFDDAKNAEAVYTKNELDPSLAVLDGHVADTVIHVTAADKTNWNGKISPDPGTGKIAKSDLPSDILYSGSKGAANGVASLGADARLPFTQAPLSGAWETQSHTWAQFEAEWSLPISYAAAKIIINSGDVKIYADYDKARATLYGIKYDSTLTFGDVTGNYSGAQTVTLTATTAGLTFTNGNPSSPSEPNAISILIRQDG